MANPDGTGLSREPQRHGESSNQRALAQPNAEMHGPGNQSTLILRRALFGRSAELNQFVLSRASSGHPDSGARSASAELSPRRRGHVAMRSATVTSRVLGPRVVTEGHGRNVRDPAACGRFGSPASWGCRAEPATPEAHPSVGVLEREGPPGSGPSSRSVLFSGQSVMKPFTKSMMGCLSSRNTPPVPAQFPFFPNDVTPAMRFELVPPR